METELEFIKSERFAVRFGSALYGTIGVTDEGECRFLPYSEVKYFPTCVMKQIASRMSEIEAHA